MLNSLGQTWVPKTCLCVFKLHVLGWEDGTVCKGDLSLTPQNPHKKLDVALRRRERGENGGSLGLGQLIWRGQASQRTCLKKTKQINKQNKQKQKPKVDGSRGMLLKVVSGLHSRCTHTQFISCLRVRVLYQLVLEPEFQQC